MAWHGMAWHGLAVACGLSTAGLGTQRLIYGTAVLHGAPGCGEEVKIACSGTFGREHCLALDRVHAVPDHLQLEPVMSPQSSCRPYQCIPIGRVIREPVPLERSRCGRLRPKPAHVGRCLLDRPQLQELFELLRIGRHAREICGERARGQYRRLKSKQTRTISSDSKMRQSRGSANKPRLRIEQEFLPGLHVVLNDIRPHACLHRKPSPSGVFRRNVDSGRDRVLCEHATAVRVKRYKANSTGDAGNHRFGCLHACIGDLHWRS